MYGRSGLPYGPRVKPAEKEEKKEEEKKPVSQGFKSCKANGSPGLCRSVSSCSSGMTVSGLCPGPASVKCCLEKEESTAREEKPAEKPKPKFPACVADGSPGLCRSVSSCGSGMTVAGLCAGPASIRCCLEKEQE